MWGLWSRRRQSRESAVWSRVAWMRERSCSWMAETSRLRVTRVATLWVLPSSAVSQYVGLCHTLNIFASELHLKTTPKLFCALTAWDEVLHWRDLRACVGCSRGQNSRWCHQFGQQQPLWQRYSYLHHKWRHCTQIHSRGGRGPGEWLQPANVFLCFGRKETFTSLCNVYTASQARGAHHISIWKPSPTLRKNLFSMSSIALFAPDPKYTFGNPLLCTSPTVNTTNSYSKYVSVQFKQGGIETFFQVVFEDGKS